MVALAAVVVGFASFCATDGFGFEPGLFDLLRIYGDLDKTMLGTGRLVHFLCLAVLVPVLGRAVRLSTMPFYAAFCTLGGHSLFVFALLSLLAAAGQVVAGGLGHSVLLDLVVIGGGLAALYGATRLLDGPARLHPSALTNALFRR